MKHPPQGRSAGGYASPRTAEAGGISPRIAEIMLSTRRVSRTRWTRKTRAPNHVYTAVAARPPARRSPAVAFTASPTMSWSGHDTSTGHPIATRSSSRRVTSAEGHAFSPCATSMMIRAGSTPAVTARVARSSGPTRPAPYLRCPGGQVERTDQARAVPHCGLDQPGIPAAPKQIGARGTRLMGHLAPPGVHADDELRVRVPDRRDERDGPPDLLPRVGVARTRGNLDDVRALGDHGMDALHGGRGIPAPGRGISHDQELMRLEDPPSEPKSANRVSHPKRGRTPGSPPRKSRPRRPKRGRTAPRRFPAAWATDDAWR